MTDPLQSPAGASQPIAEPTGLGQEGPFAYENWRSALSGALPGDSLEYPLFTDARLAGEILDGLGPYQVLNCISDPVIDPRKPALMLRAAYHVTTERGPMIATDDARYHGGTLSDEMAALLSLLLGIRLQAGSPTRWFKAGSDPRGRPWSLRAGPKPDPLVQRSSYGATIPRLRKDVLIEAAPPRLLAFPTLSPADAIALVRAARLYQDAVWVAESEPSLSWLLLVSAIEVAAGQWRREQESPRQRLAASRPGLDDLLVARGGDALADEVAAMIADSLGATRKFVGFCTQFMPPPPEPRPSVSVQIDWSPPEMRRLLGRLYAYRSRALHNGTPFPTPMSLPPHAEGATYAERPLGLANGSLGGTWMAADLPMLLYAFEHIARGALLAWWDAIVQAPSGN